MDENTAQDDPATPEKTDANAIQQNESFKTCKTTVLSPATRRTLRMTPARTSILSGGTPFKETPPVKRFNTRRNNLTSQSTKKAIENFKSNDTLGSNETFIMCEQQLMFERDSLEPNKILNPEMVNAAAAAANAKPASLEVVEPFRALSLDVAAAQQEQEVPAQQGAAPKPAASAPASHFKAPSNNRTPKKISGPTFIKPATRAANRAAILASSLIASSVNSARGRASALKSRCDNARTFLVTPKISYKKPASLMGTASRYLQNHHNTSRLIHTQSFKSTAELEKDFFSSLRSSRGY